MQMELEVLFTSGTNIVGEVVEFTTRSRWSHAAIIIDNAIIEAVQPCVRRMENLSHYDNEEHEKVKILIPDYEAALAEANSLIGVKYGLFTDCVSGGLYDVVGFVLDGNGEATVNCSETVTRILRAGGLDILHGISADCVTPEHLYRALQEIKI